MKKKWQEKTGQKEKELSKRGTVESVVYHAENMKRQTDLHMSQVKVHLLQNNLKMWNRIENV